MAEHAHKQCPRCNDNFECNSGSIVLCQCHKVALNNSHHEYINSLYNDCLCVTCLIALRDQYNTEHTHAIATPQQRTTGNSCGQ